MNIRHLFPSGVSICKFKILRSIFLAFLNCLNHCTRLKYIAKAESLALICLSDIEYLSNDGKLLFERLFGMSFLLLAHFIGN
jgi:hypothetical protein